MPKIEVIVDGVDVTPKRLLSDEMIALAAKNLGDPNMSNTFMGELSLQSFGFQDQTVNACGNLVWISPGCLTLTQATCQQQ